MSAAPRRIRDEYGIERYHDSVTDDQIRQWIWYWCEVNRDGTFAGTLLDLCARDRARAERLYVECHGHGFGGWVTGP